MANDIETSVTHIVRHQYSSLPMALTPTDCAGKTWIVTGANSGLGLECVKHLVHLGSAKVVMTVRSLSRGKAALAEVEAATGKKGVAELWELDLGKYASIKDFVARVEQDLSRVDGIVENAAAANGTWSLVEGMESTIAVNLIATTMLAVLLIPHLSRCAKQYGITPRISIVGTALAFGRKSDLDKIGKKKGILEDVNNDKKWSIDSTNRYSLSKLLQLLAVRQLAQLAPVERTGVVINVTNPGLCNTGLTRYYESGTKFLIQTMRTMMGRSAEWGSRNLLFGLAVGKESHGQYLSYCVMNGDWLPSWISDAEGQSWSGAIWDELVADMERISPGCVERALKV